MKRFEFGISANVVVFEGKKEAFVFKAKIEAEKKEPVGVFDAPTGYLVAFGRQYLDAKGMLIEIPTLRISLIKGMVKAGHNSALAWSLLFNNAGTVYPLDWKAMYIHGIRNGLSRSLSAAIADRLHHTEWRYDVSCCSKWK